MRKFDVVFFDKKRNKNLIYKDLTGKKAIDLMAHLITKGFEPFARTESFRVEEILTFEQMKEVVL